MKLAVFFFFNFCFYTRTVTLFKKKIVKDFRLHGVVQCACPTEQIHCVFILDMYPIRLGCLYLVLLYQAITIFLKQTCFI